MLRNRNFGFALSLGVLLAAALTLAACGDDGGSAAPAPTPAPTPTPTPTPEPEPDPEPETRVYTIQYEALISGNPLFQALFGATPYPDGVTTAPPVAFIAHPRGETLWEMGATASAAMKVLAETGESADVVAEATGRGFTIQANHEDQITALLTSGNPSIEVSSDNPCFTFAQAIAPSPDWFVGFSHVCATDEDGAWLDEIAFEAAAFDAGTAAGDDFADKADGADTTQPITHLDKAPFTPAGTPVSRIIATPQSE